MQQLKEEWSKEDREFFIARAGRGMHGIPGAKGLIRGYLAHLGVHGDPEGRPVTDLRGWARRQNTKRLRELIVDYGFTLLAEHEVRARRRNGAFALRLPIKDKRTLEDQ